MCALSFFRTLSTALRLLLVYCMALFHFLSVVLHFTLMHPQFPHLFESKCVSQLINRTGTSVFKNLKSEFFVCWKRFKKGISTWHLNCPLEKEKRAPTLRSTSRSICTKQRRPMVGKWGISGPKCQSQHILDKQPIHWQCSVAQRDSLYLQIHVLWCHRSCSLQRKKQEATEKIHVP